MGSKREKKKHKTSSPSPGVRQAKETAGNTKHAGVTRPNRRKQWHVWWVWVAAVVALLVVGRLSVEGVKYLDQVWKNERAEPPTPRVTIVDDGSALSFAEIQAQRLIINVHEHIQSLEYAPIHLEVMDELGIAKICLMGSSKFTLTLNEKYGFTGYDENNEELLKIVKQYPGRFEAWCVVNPLDRDKLEKFKDYVARGATGLKLYTGHGYVTKDDRYMFHPVAMDDPGMLPLYAYCEKNYIPVCIHVNPYKAKRGFAEEFIAVLTQFPDMKVDCPHFMLSSVKSSRLREFLDTFPNLYTDISYGDYFMAERLKYMSKYPAKFRQLFADYPDRIMYATDLVLTQGRTKTREWVHEQFKAYLDMLTKETYTTTAIPGVTLNGLALPDYLLERVLFKNYEDFLAKRPKGTRTSRKINWNRMNVTPTGRRPGQAFPPRPEKKK